MNLNPLAVREGGPVVGCVGQDFRQVHIAHLSSHQFHRLRIHLLRGGVGCADPRRVGLTRIHQRKALDGRRPRNLLGFASVRPLQREAFNTVVEHAVAACSVDRHDAVLPGADEHALGSVDEVRAVERKDVACGILNAVAREVDVGGAGVQDLNPFTAGPRVGVVAGPRIGHRFGHDDVAGNHIVRDRRRVDLTRCWVVGLNPVCGGAARVLLVALPRHDASPSGLVEVVVGAVHERHGHAGVGHVEARNSVSSDDDVLPRADGPG